MRPPGQRDEAVGLGLAEHPVDGLAGGAGHRGQVVLGQGDGLGRVAGVDVGQAGQAAHDAGLGREIEGVEQRLGGGPQSGVEHAGHRGGGGTVVLPQRLELGQGEAEGLGPLQGHHRRRPHRTFAEQGLFAEGVSGAEDIEGDHVPHRAGDVDRHCADVDEVHAVPGLALMTDEGSLGVALPTAAGQELPPVGIRQCRQQLPFHRCSSRVGRPRIWRLYPS
jgi:hypothetical protein